MKRRKKNCRKKKRHRVWEPFVRVTRLADGTELPRGQVVVQNNLYVVSITRWPSTPVFGRVFELSIKQRNKEPIRDWRDLQRIKNELLGADVEAVELYPAESRLMDTANQYYLYALPDYSFPFGYTDRQVLDANEDGTIPGFAGSRQRPFRETERPEDAMTGTEYLARIKDDPEYGLRTAAAFERLGPK